MMGFPTFYTSLLLPYPVSIAIHQDINAAHSRDGVIQLEPWFQKTKSAFGCFNVFSRCKHHIQSYAIDVPYFAFGILKTITTSATSAASQTATGSCLRSFEGFPKQVYHDVPLNHPFYFRIFHSTIQLLGIPHCWKSLFIDVPNSHWLVDS